MKLKNPKNNLEDTLPEQLGIVGPDPVDLRDHQYVGAPPEVLAVMPTIEQGYDVENEIGKTPNFDQHSTWGCGPFGLSNDYTHLVLAALGIIRIVSKRWIYGHCVIPGGKGTYIRELYRFAKNVGLCEDRLMPTYKPDGNLDEAWLKNLGTVTPEMIANALENRIDEYLSIPSDNFSLICQAVFENKGVGCGLRGVNATSGHFFEFKGFRKYGGYDALVRKDSIPVWRNGVKDYNRYIVKIGDKYYQENSYGSQVVLYSHWTAKKDFSNAMKIDKAIAEKLCKVILHRPSDPAFMNYTGEHIKYVLDEIEQRAKEWKAQDKWIKFLRFFGLIK